MAHRLPLGCRLSLAQHPLLLTCSVQHHRTPRRSDPYGEVITLPPSCVGQQHRKRRCLTPGPNLLRIKDACVALHMINGGCCLRPLPAASRAVISILIIVAMITVAARANLPSDVITNKVMLCAIAPGLKIILGREIKIAHCCLEWELYIV